MLSKVFEHLDPGRLPEPDEFPAIIAERKVFTGAIAETEWRRFQVYASRVRSVCGYFGKAPSSVQQEQVWMVLLQKSQRSPLFPRLESLTVGPSLGALMSLLCPTVDSLIAWFPDPSISNDKIGKILADVLRPHLPHIFDLELWEYNTPAHGSRPYLRLGYESIDMCMLTHLESLKLDHPVLMSQPVIQALLTFPDLYHLSLSFSILTDDRTSMRASKMTPGFLKLRELCLNASYEDIAVFLEATDPAGLEKLRIRRELRGWDDDFRGQEEAYAQIPHHIRSLYQIFTDLEARSRPRSPGDMYSPEGLLPENVLPASLQTLPDLREVVVSCQYISGAFMDGSLLALCPAWPSLETFEYRDSTDMRQWSGPGTPTFDTLLAFTRAHPHLARLTLPTLSASGIPDIGAFDTGGPLQDWPAHRALRFFRLHCSPAPHTPMLLLAIAMDRAFPRLCLGDPRLGVDATYRDDASVVFVDLLTVLMLAVQTARKISNGENVSTVLSMQEMIRSASPRRRVEHGPY
ncbi:hypothetical protein VTO73DRAFT_2170 [Trametes versicolor]